MANTTFSGPILAGSIKNTTGTTVGTDMKNTGQVVMAQSLAIDLSGGAIAAEASNVIIPANSQIIDCVFDIIIHIFTLKIFIEFLFMRITNSINFIAKYNEVIRVLPYSDDEEVKPDEITEIEDL